MYQRLKERLVGAIVLVAFTVIFIPMLLTGPIDSGSITKIDIPERPAEKFNSRLVPVTATPKPPPVEIPREVIINDVSDIDISIMEKGVDAVIDPAADIKLGQSSAEINPATAKPVKDKKVELTAWVVQLGSFSDKSNADRLSLDLRESGFPAFVELLTKNKESVYRVRVGSKLLRADADNLLRNIKTKMKLDGIVISYP